MSIFFQRKNRTAKNSAICQAPSQIASVIFPQELAGGWPTTLNSPAGCAGEARWPAPNFIYKHLLYFVSCDNIPSELFKELAMFLGPCTQATRTKTAPLPHSLYSQISELHDALKDLRGDLKESWEWITLSEITGLSERRLRRLGRKWIREFIFKKIAIMRNQLRNLTAKTCTTTLTTKQLRQLAMVLAMGRIPISYHPNVKLAANRIFLTILEKEENTISRNEQIMAECRFNNWFRSTGD